MRHLPLLAALLASPAVATSTHDWIDPAAPPLRAAALEVRFGPLARRGDTSGLAAALAGPAAADDLAARFGARPGIAHASLSPDGRRIAFVVPRDGQGSAILVQEAVPGAPATPVVRANGNPDRLAGCNWVSNRRLVCTLSGVVKAPAGNAIELMNYSRLSALDIDGKNAP